jgi:hypothetical protein
MGIGLVVKSAGACVFWGGHDWMISVFDLLIATKYNGAIDPLFRLFIYIEVGVYN